MKNKEAKTIFSSLEKFSSIPPPELWDRIEDKLDKSKKKKRIVFWWSIAASLLVGFSVLSILYFNSNHQFNDFLTEGVVETTRRDLPINIKHIVKNKVLKINQRDLNNKPLVYKTKKTLHNNKANINNQVLSTNMSSIFFSAKSKSVAQFKKMKQSQNNGTAPSLKNESSYSKNSSSSSSQSKLLKEKDNFSDSKLSISNTTNNEVYRKSKAIVENTIPEDSLNKIKSEIAQLQQTLEAINEDKIKNKKNTESIEKWSIQVFAGIASSQNYNNQKAMGNSVDSKQSTGYGIKTNYKLNKKWGVSSGLKVNELGQKIAGVSYYEQKKYSGIVTAKIPMVSDFSIQNSSRGSYELVAVSNNPSYLFASNSNTDNGFDKGNVTQNLKYFEIPLEVSYSLLNKKKASIIMNSGAFVGRLISNDILLNGNSIGENKNVNQYVYGTLLSSTLQYEFYKKTKFFVEPGMNYYANPLDNQYFSQLQLMFNFGLNFSF